MLVKTMFVLQSWPDLFLTLSMAGSEAGWEREGHSFPQLSLVFHCLRKKLPNVDLSTPVLPDCRQPTSDTSDGKFPGRRKGIAQQGCVNTRRVLQSSTQCLSSQVATRPSQSPGRQAGTEPQGLLALTTTRCLLQTSQTPSVDRRVKATGLFLLKSKRGKLIGSPWSQRQCKRVRGSGPPHTHTLESLL